MSGTGRLQITYKICIAVLLRQSLVPLALGQSKRDVIINAMLITISLWFSSLPLSHLSLDKYMGSNTLRWIILTHFSSQLFFLFPNCFYRDINLYMISEQDYECSSVNFYICIHPHIYHSDGDIEHFHHLWSLSVIILSHQKSLLF